MLISLLYWLNMKKLETQIFCSAKYLQIKLCEFGSWIFTSVRKETETTEIKEFVESGPWLIFVWHCRNFLNLKKCEKSCEQQSKSKRLSFKLPTASNRVIHYTQKMREWERERVRQIDSVYIYMCVCVCVYGIFIVDEMDSVCMC